MTICDGGDSYHTDNDGDIEHHIRDLRWLSRPRRINQLPQCGAQGICQTGQRRCADATPIREPQITVSCRSTETERLRQADEEVAEFKKAMNENRAAAGARLIFP